MAHFSFGNGWPSRNPAIITLVRRDGLRIPLHKEVAPLVAILIDLTEAGHRYDVRPDWTWGYANRPISGTSIPSNHSWGTAIDINAPKNPYASADWHRRNAKGTKPFGLQLSCDMPESMVRMWEGHGFGWGGRYTRKPDPMHFEFMGTVEQARRYTTNLRTFLGTKAPQPPKVVGPVQSDGKAARTMELQRILRVKDDGIVGAKTTEAMDRNRIGWNRSLPGNANKALVAWLQRQGQRIGAYPAGAGRVDGLVGPATNHLIVVGLGQRDGICGSAGFTKAAE
jgi:hypothetical protein